MKEKYMHTYICYDLASNYVILYADMLLLLYTSYMLSQKLQALFETRSKL